MRRVQGGEVTWSVSGAKAREAAGALSGRMGHLFEVYARVNRFLAICRECRYESLIYGERAETKHADGCLTPLRLAAELAERGVG